MCRILNCWFSSVGVVDDMICIKWQLYVFSLLSVFVWFLSQAPNFRIIFLGYIFYLLLVLFLPNQFFHFKLPFVCSDFSHAMPLLFCKRKFTNQTPVITFINLENRLFELACPFGGKNRRILRVYNWLIIS